MAGGAAALNQVWERETDGLMRRTQTRPIPDGRLRALDGTLFGTLLSAVGLIELGWQVNLISAAVAAATLVSYVLIYTPLKKRTSLATLIGAVPGALPPVPSSADGFRPDAPSRRRRHNGRNSASPRGC